MTEDSKDKFFLQYYFPPSSVGETGRVGAPGRREVGHGQLAQRALMPIIPDEVRPALPCPLMSAKHWQHPSHSFLKTNFSSRMKYC